MAREPAIPAALRSQDAHAAQLAKDKGMMGVPDAALPAKPNGQETPTAPPAPTVGQAGLDFGQDTLPAAQEPTQQQPDPTLQARYAALQGKYNAEVPRLAQQVKDLQSRLEAADNARQETERRLAEAAEQVPDWAGHIDQLGESLGDKNVSVVLDGLRQEAANLKAEIRERDTQIESLTRRLDGMERTSSEDREHRAVTDRDTFFRELQRAVPDYKDINRHQDFVTWMYTEDPSARRLGRTDAPTRQTILVERMNALDIEAVVSYYNEFKGLQQKGSDARQHTLSQQIGPDDSGAGGTTLRTDKEIIPLSFVKQFERDVQQGRYRAREGERRRIDQAIFEAQKEGRVDPRR